MYFKSVDLKERGGKLLMPKTQVNETKIYYQYTGKGTPLFFIPGLGAGINMYEPQQQYFESAYQVIIPELRGNGRSASLNGVSSNRVMDVQCQDVYELMNQLNIESAVFIGVSYGGAFCQKFASLFPNKVKGLVIADSFCDTRMKSMGIMRVIVAYSAIPMYYLPRKWLATMTAESYKKWPQAANKMQQIMRSIRRNEVTKQRLYINRINNTTFLSNIHCSVLLLSGKQMPSSWMEQIHELLPDSKLIYIEDSFDPSNLCQPDEFNKHLNDYLNKIH